MTGAAAELSPQRSCRGCGCTDFDCRGCIERSGLPCYWVAADLCSACAAAMRPALVLPTSRQLAKSLGLERWTVLRLAASIEKARESQSIELLGGLQFELDRRHGALQ